MYSYKDRLKVIKLYIMSKSSYCYQQAALKAPGKYSKIRKKIQTVFDNSSSRYDYRRIHSSLKGEKIIVSEKVVRRIIKEDNLIVLSIKRKNYNSYK